MRLAVVMLSDHQHNDIWKLEGKAAGFYYIHSLTCWHYDIFVMLKGTSNVLSNAWFGISVVLQSSLFKRKLLGLEIKEYLSGFYALFWHNRPLSILERSWDRIISLQVL